jgi:hypothetical protein
VGVVLGRTVDWPGDEEHSLALDLALALAHAPGYGYGYCSGSGSGSGSASDSDSVVAPALSVDLAVDLAHSLSLTPKELGMSMDEVQALCDRGEEDHQLCPGLMTWMSEPSVSDET